MLSVHTHTHTHVGHYSKNGQVLPYLVLFTDPGGSLGTFTRAKPGLELWQSGSRACALSHHATLPLHCMTTEWKGKLGLEQATPHL